MDSFYPGGLDNDLSIPRVDDNITEIGGEAINGLRSAVFNIEETLGINPQGTAADVATRLNQSLNPDGTIKASALSSIGLVTLPITNNQIATNAGVEESKLDLDYTTVQLKTWIDELNVFARSINEKLIVDIYNMSQHIAHPGAYGRHWTSDIDGYTGTYASYNLQGIIADLDTRIIDHITDLVDAHDASAISVDDTYLEFEAADVQTALEGLNNLGIGATIKHRDSQHNNGIIRAQKVFLDGYNHNKVLVEHTNIDTVSAGAHSVGFQSSPAGLATAQRGDVVEIDAGTKLYQFNINYVDTTNDVVYFFGAIPISVVGGTAAIYRTEEETYEPANLILAIRQSSVTSVGGSVIQMVHPNAPYILSNGADIRNLSSTNRYIKIKWQDGETADIDAYGMMQKFSPTAGKLPSTWTNDKFVQALNNLFRADSAPAGYTGTGFPYHYPLIAFTYKGEVGIALDEAISDGYVYVDTPSSNSAWSTLGFVEGDVAYYVTPRRLFLDGYEISSVRKIVDATGQTEIGVSGVKNINVDLTTLGLNDSGLVRLKNSADDGTYVYNAYTSNTLTINEHVGFSTDASVNIYIYGDSFSVPIATTSPVLYELFIDAYEHGAVELRGAARAQYRTSATSGSDPHKWFDVVAISRNFRTSEKRIYFNNSTNALSLGDRPSSGLPPDNPGAAVELPTSTPEGFQFKLFDANGVDYVEIQIAKDDFLTTAADRGIDLDISDRISEEKYLQVGTVLHNTTDFRHLYDQRQFGSVGRKDVGNDYTRDYITYPTSLLRGNGVFYGLNVGLASGKIDVYGGEVLVNGIVYQIERTQLTIPKDGVLAYYNLFVDDKGVLQLLKDNDYDTDYIATPSTSEILASSDKTLIAVILIDASNSVVGISDLRRFVGNIDNKIELLVEENDITHGSFASLRAAINYLNVVGDPIPRVIKIRGTIIYDLSDGMLSLPAGTRIIGDVNGLVDSGLGSKILLQNINASGFLDVSAGGCALENLLIEYDSTASSTYVLTSLNLSLAISDLIIKNCVFQDIKAQAIIAGFSSGSSISDCKISNCAFTFGTSPGDQSIAYVSGTASNLVLDSCSITFGSVTNNYLINAQEYSGSYGQAIGCLIKNSSINFTGATASYGIYAYRNIAYCRFENNTVFTPYSGVTKRVFSSVLSTIQDSVIDSCILYYFERLVSTSATINNIYITNNNILYLTRSILTGTTISNGYVEKNIVSAFAAITTGSVMIADIIEDLFIKNNSISLLGTTNPIIKATSTASNLYMCDNFFSTTDSTSNILYIASGNNINICGNIIDNSYVGTATGFAFELRNDCSFVNIHNNIIKNTGGSTYGFQRGIMVWGDPAGSSNVTISNNIVDGFDSTLGIGIILAKVTGATVVGNVVTNTKLALEINNGQQITVNGNHLENITGQEAVYIQNSNSRLINFVGNYILGAKDSLIAQYLIRLNGIDGYSNICENIVEMRNTDASNYGPLLINGATTFHISIMRNTFINKSGGTYNNAPVTLTGTPSNTIIAFNNFRDISASPTYGQINLGSAIRSVDYMNWGQIYYVSIPSSNVMLYRQADGDCSWYSNNFISSKWRASDTTYQSSEAHLFIEFSSNQVPVGAKILGIEVDFDINPGVVNDLELSWKEEIFNGTTTWPASTTNPPSTAGPFLVEPDGVYVSPPIYMKANAVHSLVFKATDYSASYWVDYLAARVKYTL